MTVPAYFVQDGTPGLCALEPSSATTSAKCSLEYLNEGGANFVFRILPVDDEDVPVVLRGKLLRIRKDLSTVPSAEEQLQALEENFQDLFPAENLVQHELIALDGLLPSRLNKALQSLNRPGHRVADVLSVEEVSGLLVTDMTPKVGEILLQLKPKWLTQSPNAPSGSKRCRTCAVRAQRASLAIRTATDAQESCPLDLVNASTYERERAVHAITRDSVLQEYLLNQAQPLLRKLKDCQILFDRDGILKASSSTDIQKLCKAMTLRDCTLFLKQTGSGIEARLGDLDLKQPEKLARWKKVESSLINDGWYTNTEHESCRKDEKICLLSRELK